MIVTAGGKQALFNAALALFGPGDEVITHMPGWPTLVEQIKLADATPVIVRTHAEDGFRLRADAVPRGDHAADARHHHQLAGQSDRRADVARRISRRVADEAARRGIWILLDLCYEQLIYDPTPHNLPGVLVATDARSHGAVRLGVEGVRDDRLALRLGGRARRRSSRACNALQSHSTSNVCSITQKAVVAALTGPQDCVTDDARRVPRAAAISCATGSADEPRLRAASSRRARSTCSPTSPTSCRPTASARRPSSRRRCSTRRASR